MIWIPYGNGFKQLAPAPRFFKAAYASRFEVQANQLQRPHNDLRREYPLLLLDVPHVAGAPFRAVRVFSSDTTQPAPQNSIAYMATTSRAPYHWIGDLTNGQPGYFMTGLPNATELWEIVRCEPDPADRCTFLLSPLRLPHGLPRPDFAKITEPILRGEAEQHWNELENALITHSSYQLVNAASALSEALLRSFLEAPRGHGRSLSQMLETLKDELEAGKSNFSYLSYHAMHKIRILHQSVQHPSRVVVNGGPIRPGLGLTLAEDMIVVLSALGLVQ